MMKGIEFSIDAFKTVDTMNGRRFAALFTEDGAFTFGNAATVSGRALITTYVDEFFGMIKGIRHDVHAVWESGDTIITQFTVNYVRKQNDAMSFPGVTLWTVKDRLISNYRIFLDNSALFGP